MGGGGRGSSKQAREIEWGGKKKVQNNKKGFRTQNKSGVNISGSIGVRYLKLGQEEYDHGQRTRGDCKK